MKNSDKELFKIVTDFTISILGNKKSAGMCFAVCLPLHSYLILCGYEVDLIEGEIKTSDDICNHFWIKLKDGRIIDPTADQFKKPSGDNMPKIYFGDKPSWYKVIS